jgi:hypothetical protein
MVVTLAFQRENTQKCGVIKTTCNDSTVHFWLSHIRAVSISYETNVTFPNSPFLDNFTVMGSVIVAEHLTLSCFLYLFSIISACD